MSEYLERLPDVMAEVLEDTPEEVHALAYALAKEASKGKQEVNLQEALRAHTDILDEDGDERYYRLIMNFGKYYWRVYQSIRRFMVHVHGDVFKVIKGEASEKVNELSNWDPVTKTLFLNLTSIEPEMPLRNLSPEAVANYLIVTDAVVTSVNRTVECNGGVYECPKCGSEATHTFDPIRTKHSFTPRCPECGATMDIKLPFEVTKTVIDVQEPIETAGTDPARMKAVLRYPLNVMSNLKPGDRVRLTAVLKSEFERGVVGETGRMVLEVVGVEKKDRFDSGGPVYDIGDPIELVSKCLAPDLIGENIDEVRKLISLQMFSMVDDVGRPRDRIHVLLVGDPSSGKSRLLQSAADVAGVYVSAEHVTGAGLTVAAERGEGGWTLRAGAAILADKSLLAIDEIDKATKNDLNYLLELMESGKASVAKAGITSEIKSAVTVLAAANPTGGSLSEAMAKAAMELGYENYQEAVEEVGKRALLVAATNITSPMASRFDFIVPMEYPKNDPEFYTKVITSSSTAGKVDGKTVKKARSLIYKANTDYDKVTIPEKLEGVIYEELKDLLNTTDFSPRMAMSIARLAKAHARAHFRNKVNEKDVRVAFNVARSLIATKDTAIELHELEVKKIEKKRRKKEKRERAKTKTGKRQIVLEVIEELYDGEPLTLSEIAEKVKEYGVKRSELETILDELVDDGELLQPEPYKYMPL